MVGGKPSTSRFERARGLWWVGIPLHHVLSERGGCGGREASKGVVWWVGNPLPCVMSERGGCGGRETLYLVFREREGVVVGGNPPSRDLSEGGGLWWAGNEQGGCGGHETLHVAIRAREGVVVGGKFSTLRFERTRGLWWA